MDGIADAFEFEVDLSILTFGKTLHLDVVEPLQLHQHLPTEEKTNGEFVPCVSHGSASEGEQPCMEAAPGVGMQVLLHKEF